VRRLIQWTLVPVVVAAVACKSDKPTQTAMSNELKRDLQLASATQNIRISPDEISPKSQQELTVRPKRAPTGPKVIRTEKPTVKASAVPHQVAEIKTDIPQVQVMAAAPAPSETPSADAPPLARPAALPTPTYPTAGPLPGNGSGGAGGVIAGVFGAVIRGGGVGDDDHCDPRGMPRRPNAGRPVGGDIFTIFGGMGGGRMQPPPMVPRRRIR
jgi:hypothetical protein